MDDADYGVDRITPLHRCRHSLRSALDEPTLKDRQSTETTSRVKKVRCMHGRWRRDGSRRQKVRDHALSYCFLKRIVFVLPVLFVVLLLTSAAQPAFADSIDLITNGDFEAGSLAGWDTYGSSAYPGSKFYALENNGGTSPIQRANIPRNPTGGNYIALADEMGTGSEVLLQTFTL